MAKIAGISSKLTLNTSQFSTAMYRARQQTAKFVGGISDAGVRVAKYALGLAAAGKATGLYIIHRNRQAIDATTKFADRIGIATEQLTGLRYAASQTGVASKELDMGLQRMTRRIAAAAAGSGPAVAALEKLGLSAQELLQMSPDEQFRSIADAMGGIGTQGEKVQTAFAIFDSGGVGLLNTMRGGAEAISEAQAEAEKLGLTFDRIQAAKVEAANDALARLSGLATGAGQSLTIGLAPYIEAAATKLLELGTSGQSMSDRIVQGIEWTATAIAKASDWLELFKAGFHSLQAGATWAIYRMVKNLDMMQKAIVAVANIIPGVELKTSEFISQYADNLARDAKAAWGLAEQAADRFTSGPWLVK